MTDIPFVLALVIVFVQIVIFQEHFACGQTVQLVLKGVQEQQGNALLVSVVQEKLGHQ